MELEKAIHQKKFKSPQQKLAVNLIYTSNWLNSFYATLLKEADITIQQFNVLRILRGQHPNVCNLKLIKSRMLDKMSDASRIVDRLVLKKLVERKVCNDDRRNINLLITTKGLELLKSMDKMDTEMKTVFSNLSIKEIDLINELLDKMRGDEN